MKLSTDCDSLIWVRGVGLLELVDATVTSAEMVVTDLSGGGEGGSHGKLLAGVE